MKKPLKAIFFVIYIAGILSFGAFLAYRNFFGGEKFTSLENRHAITFIAAFTAGLVKLCARGSGRKSPAFYKKAYGEIIGDSFSDDKKSLRTLLKAIALYNEDKFKKSILLLQSIRGDCKTTGEKYCVELFLALNYTDSGDNGDAIDIYENMSRRGIADSRMYSNLANLYTDEGDFEKACESARNAVTFDPKNYSAHNNLAYSSFRGGDYESAKKAAEDCLKIKGDFLPSIKLLYIIHSLNGNHDEAESYARKAIANGLSKKELQETLEYYIGGE